MTENIPNFKQLPEGRGNFLFLPNFKAAMCGVSRIFQTNTGEITLVYTDGETESAQSDKDIMTDFGENVFNIISFVQEKMTPCD